MQLLLSLLRDFGFSDAIDILILMGLFFLTFSLIKGTRSSVALRGLVALVVLSFGGYVISRFLGLVGVTFILGHSWIVIVLIFLIVFQNDFKKALTDLGQMRIFRAFFRQSGQYLDALIKAVEEMSQKRTGALIAIERRNPLRVYSETGTRVDAAVSSELIRTIFTHLTPLHDGAIIIRNGRIESAGCILPLTESQDIPSGLGTRHRAALGLSDETDAAVIAVSEETGTISLAINGRIFRGQTADALREALTRLMNITEEEKE